MYRVSVSVSVLQNCFSGMYRVCGMWGVSCIGHTECW